MNGCCVKIMVLQKSEGQGVQHLLNCGSVMYNKVISLFRVPVRIGRSGVNAENITKKSWNNTDKVGQLLIFWIPILQRG